MKRSVVIKAKRLKPINWDFETIILFTLFLCGVILGVFLIKNCSDDIKNLLARVVSDYISAKSQNSFTVCFSGLFILVLIFIFFSFMFGLCAVGTPLIWLLPIIFGAFGGGYVSILLMNYGLKGLLYFVIVDMVCYAITTATLMNCCCESTKISVNLFSCIAGNNNLKNACLFKNYALNYLVLCVPVALSAVLSTILFKIFQGLFIFA